LFFIHSVRYRSLVRRAVGKTKMFSTCFPKTLCFGLVFVRSCLTQVIMYNLHILVKIKWCLCIVWMVHHVACCCCFFCLLFWQLSVCLCFCRIQGRLERSRHRYTSIQKRV